MSEPVLPALPDEAYAGAGNGKVPQLNYFNRPLLRKLHWDERVITYLFLGGAMGGSGVLAALAQRSGNEPLTRTSRYLSLALAVACPAVLVSHLGRPERFHHMLRIAKLKSPMSMGAWALVGFGALAALNAGGQLSRDGVLPAWIRRLEAPFGVRLQGMLGAFTTGYTGVLLSATAVPLWARGKYHIPAASVCSAIASACALNSLALTRDRNGGEAQIKLERLEACASVLELGLLLHFRSHAGATGKPMFEGARGERLRTWTIGAGILAPLALNAISLLTRNHKKRPFVLRALLGGALTLAGGYIFRETLIEAGKASCEDPEQAFYQSK